MCPAGSGGARPAPRPAGSLVPGRGASEAVCFSLFQPQQLEPHVQVHKLFHRHSGQMPSSASTGSKLERTCRGMEARKGRALDLWVCLVTRQAFAIDPLGVYGLIHPLTRVCLFLLRYVCVYLSTY